MSTAPPSPSSLPELHLHLDGSLRRSTLEELAEPLGVDVPPDLGFYDGIGLQGALACFETSLAVLQTGDAVERVAREICEDAAAGGVTTLEIRFAPQLHRGARVEEIVDAALSGIGAFQDRAGLVLCGLYGEAPAIFDRFLEVAATRSGVIGIDLAGGPASGHEWRLEDYAEAFSRAREAGLGRTVHAGEGRPPAEIRTAIECLHADRIGHGTTLLEDPSLVDLVLEHDVTIEACPTSNVHVGAIPAVAAHPLPEWLRLGIKACVNADNTLFSAVDTAEEHRRAAAIPGMTGDLLRTAIAHGHAAAFPRR